MKQIEKSGETEVSVERLTAKRRHHRTWLVIGILLLITIAAVIKIVTAPVGGHTISVDQTYKPAPVKQSTVTIPSSTASNNYFSLQLPAGYQQRPAQTNVSGIIMSQTVTKPGAYGTAIINIAVQDMPSGGLSNVSVYQNRILLPQTYNQQPETITGDMITISNRTDGTDGETVAFWPHGQYLATIAVTIGLGGGDAGEQAENVATLQTLLHAWQWH